MKIVSFRAENFQRIKAVEITPEGNLVRISGRNEQGKSSILDAIWAAIGGARHAPAVPVRTGADRAVIELDLGDLKVTRTFKNVPGEDPIPILTVKGKDGGTMSNPQKVLDRLTGLLTFDPLAFARAKDADRIPILRSFVPDFDFAANDAAIKENFDARTIAGRDLKSLTAQLEAAVVPEENPERVDVEALVADLDAAGRTAADIERAAGVLRSLRERAERARLDASSHREEASRLRLEAKALIERAELADAKATESTSNALALEREAAGLPAPPPAPDTSEIRRRIEEGRKTNEKADARLRAERERAGLRGKTEAKRDEVEGLTKKIEQLRQARKNAIAGSKLPVEGLEFDGDATFLDGLPFEQASTSRKIRVSAAIAAALNPQLRVIQIRDGSLLDDDAKRMIAEFAAEHDMQFWMEEVDGSGEVGIYIEDGMVAAVHAEAAE